MKNELAKKRASRRASERLAWSLHFSPTSILDVSHSALNKSFSVEAA